MKCSFCGNPNDLVFAHGAAMICAGCVERAYEALHGRRYVQPFDSTYGGMLEAVAVAECRAMPPRIHLVHSRRV